jgi:two-component system response regulator HydG
LEAEVNAGRFRRDLFYRLGVIHIELPSLRQRGDDVILLAEHFLQILRPASSRVQGFSDEVTACFQEYQWPGNIRELRNVVERAVALAKTETIEVSDLPPSLQSSKLDKRKPATEVSTASRYEALDDAEHSYLTSLLHQHHGNVSQAALQAGMSRQGMHKLLKKHGIAAADFRE